MLDQDSTNSNLPKPILLPVSKFGSHPNRELEEKLAVEWRSGRLASKVAESVKGRPLFVLHDGPPYANGAVHMGHAVNKVLKDAIVRSQRALGKDATFVAGWDCHGLPIEWKVEENFRAQGRSRNEIPLEEFRQACAQSAQKWVGEQANGFSEFGVLADWQNPYLTMQPQAVCATVKALHEVMRKGLLRQGLRPVLWSVAEGTALADAEVEYVEVSYTAVLVRFPVMEESMADSPLSLVCWTTTPWSIPGNRAVAFNPKADYCTYLIQEVGENSQLIVGERVVLSVEVADNLLTRARCTLYSRLEQVDSSFLQGLKCQHPLHALGYTHSVPVLPADWVEAGTGSGFVHVAPGLGPEDFALGKEYGLEVIETVDAGGNYLHDIPWFAGMQVISAEGKWGEANSRLLEALNEAGAVVSQWKARHPIAHSWRSKSPLIYRTTLQWFVNLNTGLREDALSALDQVKFMPESSRTRLAGMVALRPDWCISRQRSWGVPMGLFVSGTGEILQDELVLARTLEIFKTQGSDAWFQQNSSQFLGSEYSDKEWFKIRDVLDVWFESGATHSWVLGMHSQNAGLQADLYLEGTDQHRGWFQASLLESVATKGVAPYRTLLTHGFVLDRKGKKMSKSEGNVVDPVVVARKSGRDALRLWVLSASTDKDIKYSEEAMRAPVESLRKFRNTLKWSLGNLAQPFDRLDYDQMEVPEKWLLAKIYSLDQELRTLVQAYDFAELIVQLNAFVSNDLSAVWFNMRRDSFYCDSIRSNRRRSAATALDLLFRFLVSWLAPMLPFTAQEAWAEYSGEGENVHFMGYFSPLYEWQNQDLLAQGVNMQAIRVLVLSQIEIEQKSGNLSSVLQAYPTIRLNADLYKNLEDWRLDEVCGLSGALVMVDDQTSVKINHAEGEKCLRCWRVMPEVKMSSCLRCQAVD